MLTTILCSFTREYLTPPAQDLIMDFDSVCVGVQAATRAPCRQHDPSRSPCAIHRTDHLAITCRTLCLLTVLLLARDRTSHDDLPSHSTLHTNTHTTLRLPASYACTATAASACSTALASTLAPSLEADRGVPIVLTAHRLPEFDLERFDNIIPRLPLLGRRIRQLRRALLLGAQLLGARL